jgi:hypothetical protein
MKELFNILVNLYGNSNSAEALLSRAGLETKFIDLSGAPMVFWQRIIEDVENRKSLTQLLEVVIEDYPQQEAALQQALLTYIDKVKETPEKKNIERKPGSQVMVSGLHLQPKTVSIEHLYSIFTNTPNSVLLLGGGASQRSGIPLSEGLVEKATRWHYCLTNGLDFADFRVKRSDWLQLLKKQPWFKPSSLVDNFSLVIHHLLQPRDNRKEFFRHILDPGVPPSIGYEHLAEFMFLRMVTTVLTTNFDLVLPNLCQSRRRPHTIDLVENPSIHKLISTSPRHPLVVYLYGSAEYYIDRFENDRMQCLKPELVSRLVPILRDHPLIVIGYGGSEEAIMRHLLLEQVETAEYFQQGIYWCAINYNSPADLHPLVQEFASIIRGNFQVVPIVGFDELMESLWAIYQERRPDLRTVKIPEGETVTSPPTGDMQPISGSDLNELEWASMRSKLVHYCNAMDILVPSEVDREWIIDQLCKLDLAIKLEYGRVLPTTAGYLLFGRKPQERVPASRVILRINGQDQIIEGNLWNQLDLITNALTEFNRPFRLKGEVSETVFPYPPLALKEVVVNALVHRHYDNHQYVIIQIDHDRIQISNPGGLVDEVIRQAGGVSLFKNIERGRRGIKGYRNPVIADLFYGGGAMDKEGSGLADVHRLVIDNGGNLSFDSIKNNTEFEVVIFSRPEAVDKVTGTASPLIISTRYAGNLMEILELPAKVWQAPIIFRTVKEVWEATKTNWLPPFIINGGQAYTFYSLIEEINPLREHVDITEIKPIEFKAFIKNGDDERRLVWLMNECLFRHLDNCHLIVDKRRKRAYFPRAHEGNREITYQSRLRRSTRTVAKQIKSPTTQKIRYWEHKSFSFSFERFGDTWALHVLPSYVFTVNGWRELLSGDRVNRLSTQRASRDYNNTVHNDLIFWAWVLSGGEQGSFTLQMGPSTASNGQNTPEKNSNSDVSITNKGNKVITKYNGENPLFVLKSTLPIVTINSPEVLPEEDDEMAGLEGQDELAELEEELAALAEQHEQEKINEKGMNDNKDGH